MVVDYPKYVSSATYDSSMYPGEDYSGEEYIVDVDGFETLDQLLNRMDELDRKFASSKYYYSEDLDLSESPDFDYSDVDEYEDALKESKMSKPIEPLSRPSNNSPQRGGVGPKIASATTSSGESTEDASQV